MDESSPAPAEEFVLPVPAMDQDNDNDNAPAPLAFEDERVQHEQEQHEEDHEEEDEDDAESQHSHGQLDEEAQPGDNEVDHPCDLSHQEQVEQEGEVEGDNEQLQVLEDALAREDQEHDCDEATRLDDLAVPQPQAIQNTDKANERSRLGVKQVCKKRRANSDRARLLELHHAETMAVQQHRRQSMLERAAKHVEHERDQQALEQVLKKRLTRPVSPVFHESRPKAEDKKLSSDELGVLRAREQSSSQRNNAQKLISLASKPLPPRAERLSVQHVAAKSPELQTSRRATLGKRPRSSSCPPVEPKRVKSSRPSTAAHSPHFSDRRRAGALEPVPEDEEEERSQEPAAFKPHQPTRPKSPQFRTSRRASARSQVREVAEEGGAEAKAYQPVVRLEDSLRSSVAGEFKKHEPTRPNAPTFRSDSRSRPPVKSSAEREWEELQQQPRPQPRPVPKAVLEGDGMLGVKGAERIPRTQPQSPKLNTALRHREAEQPKPPSPLRARPMPNFTSASVGLGPVEFRESTRPKSPEFRTKARSEMWALHQHSPEQQSERAKALEARPMPAFPTPEKIRADQKPTMPHDLGLRTELRGAMHKLELEKQLREEEEELRRKRMVVANPMPVGDPFVPAPSPREPTHPKDLGLATEVRGATHQQQLQQRRKEEEAQIAEACRVHAREALVLQQAPFVPKKSQRALTEIHVNHINSDVRAEARKKFDSELKERHELQERVRAEMELQQKAREEAELREFMAAHAPKARPVPMTTYVPEKLAPVEPVLTCPHTPNFRSAAQ